MIGSIGLQVSRAIGTWITGSRIAGSRIKKFMVVIPIHSTVKREENWLQVDHKLSGRCRCNGEIELRCLTLSNKISGILLIQSPSNQLLQSFSTLSNKPC
ncbi:hypothetical protein LINGRAHAP2_LOCUS21987 [Linum grandiflorum]